jgi:hypothetical protein
VQKHMPVDGHGAELDDEYPEVVQPQALGLELCRNPTLSRVS